MRPALSAIASPILLTLKDVLSDFPGRRLGSCRARMEVPGEDTSLSKRARTFDYDYLVSLPPILILNPPLHLPSGEDLGALHDRPAKARVHDDLAHRAKSMQVHEIGVHPLTARAKAACPPVNPDGSRTLLTKRKERYNERQGISRLLQAAAAPGDRSRLQTRMTGPSGC